MVIADNFVWAHLPKTGGDSTHKLFRCLGLDCESDSIRQSGKHHSFAQREKATGQDLTDRRRRIMNIRRLPSWVLSRAKHQERNNGYPVDRDLLHAGRVAPIQGIVPAQKVAGLVAFLFGFRGQPFQRQIRGRVIRRLTKLGPPLTADQALQAMRCGRVDHWIRLEHLADDFLHVMNQFAEVTLEQRAAVQKLQPQNTGDYARDLDQWFSRDDLCRAYQNNPVWTAIEREVYGAALVDLDAPLSAA